jgi:hypothetical protein
MRTPNPTTSLPELTAILLVRLCVLWSLVLISLLLPNDDAVFYAFMGIAFIITIPYSLWLRNKLQASRFAPLQFLVDMVLVTGLVYFTGGINSDLTLLYPLVILSAGIVGTPRQTAEITILGIVVYTLMVTMLSQDLIVEYLPAGKTAGQHAVYPALFIRILIFAFFGMVGVYVSKRCNFINHHKEDAMQTTESLLRNLQSATLVLDPQGRILLANHRACEMLTTTEESLRTMEFTALFATGKHPIPETYGKAAYLARTNLPPVPVAYRTADTELPATALPEASTDQAHIPVTLLALLDISHSLELERQLQQIERITAATRIAGEMAHEIRTPLTAISASVQLLKHYEEKATSADWLPNSPRRRDRMELFEHISGASAQMDSVIQNFLDFAAFSPADLLSIIKLDSLEENQGYMDNLNTIVRGLENGQNSDSGRRSNDPELVKQNTDFKGL